MRRIKLLREWKKVENESEVLMAKYLGSAVNFHLKKGKSSYWYRPGTTEPVLMCLYEDGTELETWIPNEQEYLDKWERLRMQYTNDREDKL